MGLFARAQSVNAQGLEAALPFAASGLDEGAEIGPLDGIERGAGPALLRDKLQQVSELLGMRPREVGAALRQGKTVAELADEQGVALDEVADALNEPVRERLAVLVDEGVLTPEQAAYLTAQAETRTDALLTLPPRGALHAPPLHDLATVLEQSEDELVAALRAGQTPAELVAAAGIAPEQVASEMVALRDAALSEKVALDLMTETQKGLALHHYEQRLTAIFSGERPARER